MGPREEIKGEDDRPKIDQDCRINAFPGSEEGRGVIGFSGHASMVLQKFFSRRELFQPSRHYKR
jgi:hypothetical protein